MTQKKVKRQKSLPGAQALFGLRISDFGHSHFPCNRIMACVSCHRYETALNMDKERHDTLVERGGIVDFGWRDPLFAGGFTAAVGAAMG